MQIIACYTVHMFLIALINAKIYLNLWLDTFIRIITQTELKKIFWYYIKIGMRKIT